MLPYPQKEFYPVANVKEKAWPFKIKAKENNDTLVILAHGFTSSPGAMVDLADFLAQNAIDVEAVLLAGHGSDLNALAEASHHDWISSFEKVLVANLDKYKNIFLIGYSLGANVAVYLANKYSRINGLVVFGAPIFIRKEKLAKFFLPFYQFLRIKTWKKMWLNPDDLEQMSAIGSQTDIPIKSIVEFYNFISDHSKKNIKEFARPILLVHSRFDNVSDPYSSQFIFSQIKSTDKELYILGKASHGIFHKNRHDFLFKKILSFIRKRSY